jgi:hypothetical protein
MSESTPASAQEAAPRTRTRTAARRKAAPRKKSASRRKAARGGLPALLNRLSAQASKAGAAIAAGATGGKESARAALAKARGASRQAVKASVREWKKLDTPRKVEFVAALLAALAAASGTVAVARKKR